MDLIIVESPTKAKTFTKLLPKNFYVFASKGHLRDLPSNKLGIDIKNNFRPQYEKVKDKIKIIDELCSISKKADKIILATDSDREGEAIAYHIAYLLGFVKENWPNAVINSHFLERIVFHEITEEALEEALKKPMTINLNLVNAQQARRILDRIVGYKLSPLLWFKIGKKWLSAGRVQTVALRFIVEREKDINSFPLEKFFKIEATFLVNNNDYSLFLEKKNNVSYIRKKIYPLFDGQYTYTVTTITNDSIPILEKDLKSDVFFVEDIKTKKVYKSPPPPFTTSTLQQTAYRILGFSSKQTMRLAQELYEKGLITYHRTDSVKLSSSFVKKATQYIKNNYGLNYLVKEPRKYKAKSKLAQEAHEAIRPTEILNNPEEFPLSSHLAKKLYFLIENRALASLMADAQINVATLIVKGKKGYIFISNYENIEFEGYLKINSKNEKSKNFSIPKKGDIAFLKNLNFLETETNPPPRYSEASLIKTLEEKGIGRPSTYSPIISKITDRIYVEKNEGKFYPTSLGITVCNFLSNSFPEIFDVNFTARMEDGLDTIAQGKQNMISLLESFYNPFSKTLEIVKKNKTHINIEEKTEEKCDICKAPLVVRYSRYGKFYACSNYPACNFTKSFIEKLKLKCPECGSSIVIKHTKNKKKFYGCSGYPKCNFSTWHLRQIKTNK